MSILDTKTIAVTEPSSRAEHIGDTGGRVRLGRTRNMSDLCVTSFSGFEGWDEVGGTFLAGIPLLFEATPFV